MHTVLYVTCVAVEFSFPETKESMKNYYFEFFGKHLICQYAMIFHVRYKNQIINIPVSPFSELT